jgi:hypothetical protein
MARDGQEDVVMGAGVRMGAAAPCVVAWLASRVVKVAGADVCEAVAVAASGLVIAAGNGNGVARDGRSGRGVPGSGRRRWSRVRVWRCRGSLRVSGRG